VAEHGPARRVAGGGDLASFERIKAIFLAACELDPQERPAYLDGACAGDDPLRGAVERLLVEDGRPDGLVDEMVRAARDRLALVGAAAADAPGQPPAGADEPAPAIAGYRVERVIGRGGMGVVYEAEQGEPRRRVALKVIRPGRVSRAVLRRFRLEAQVLGQLRHPGIARIYDAGTVEDGTSPYLAMELIDGPPLTEYARARRLGAGQRLALVARVCDALHHAHQKGIVHRDLKPGNILVEEAGESDVSAVAPSSEDAGPQPRILDFGVARMLDAEAHTFTEMTDVGQVVGTVPYMSPEQAAGDPAAIDIRTDVYAMGVIAFELLAERLPYDVSGMMVHESMRVIREQEPSRLSSVNRVFRGDIETIVAKALEKDPQRRYQSASDLAADIRRYLSDQPIVARPPSVPYQLRKFVRRNRALASGVAIAFATLLVATTISLWQWRAARRAESESTGLRTIAEARAGELAEAAWRSYRVAIQSAVAALERRDRVAASRFLDVAAEGRACWEHRYLSARLDRGAAAVDPGEPVRAVAFEGAESGFVVACATGRLRRFDATGVERGEAIQLDEALTGPAAFSAQGQRLLAVVGADASAAAVWDAQHGRRLATIDPAQLASLLDGLPLHDVVLSPDGRRALLCADLDRRRRRSGAGPACLWPIDGQVIPLLAAGDSVRMGRFSTDGQSFALVFFRPQKEFVLDFDASGERRRPRPLAQHNRPMSFTTALALIAEPPQVFLGSSRGEIRLVDMTSAAVVRTFETGTLPITALGLGPGDGVLAAGAADGSIHVFDVRSAELIDRSPGHSGSVIALAFDPDGTRLAGVTGEGVRVLDLGSSADSQVLRGHGQYVYGIAFDSSGQRLVSGAWDGDLRVWDARTGAALAVLPTGGRILCVAASPSGPMVATGHEKGRVNLWDIETGAHLLEVDARQALRVNALAFTADGAALLMRTRRGVTVIDPASGARLRVIDARGATQVGAMALSPDGALLAADSAGDVLVVDACDGREVWRLRGHGHPGADRVVFSPDGSLLASAGRDNTVRLWELATGTLRHELAGHDGNVYALAFSPDGSRLASGGNDRLILLWDVPRGDMMLRLAGHEEYVFDLAFAPDGSMLASGSGDATVRLWDAIPGREGLGGPRPPQGP
jgi:WD40 repeat protein/serine/threonine protein kinase